MEDPLKTSNNFKKNKNKSSNKQPWRLDSHRCHAYSFIQCVINIVYQRIRGRWNCTTCFFFFFFISIRLNGWYFSTNQIYCNNKYYCSGYNVTRWGLHYSTLVFLFQFQFLLLYSISRGLGAHLLRWCRPQRTLKTIMKSTVFSGYQHLAFQPC